MKHLVLFTGMLFLPLTLFAHNLDVTISASGDVLQIQAWMGDDPAADADIEITGESGDVLASGVLNEDGIYRWKPETAQAVSVMVYAEAGHEKTIDLDRDAVQKVLSGTSEEPETKQEKTSTSSEIYSSSRARQKNFGLLLGITFIIALTALYLSYRNHRKLCQIEEMLETREIRD